ncbi:MAG: hypothetical protein J6W82_06620 [Bacteroidales bacterium]|nr:hypothetical protein [Bacteroidales bacterium]
MDAVFIVTVALAAAVVVVILALLCLVIYYRWQIGDKNATLGRFIDENERLREKINRIEFMNH